MKKLKNQSIIIGAIFVIAAVSLFGFIFLKQEKPQPQIELNYLEKFTGFDEKTKIQAIYQIDEDTIIEKSLIISENVAIINNDLSLTAPYRISYLIQNQNENIDINIARTTGEIRTSFSGLEKSSLVSISLNNGYQPTPIPVDWAGRIELKISSQLQNTKYCILIKNDKNVQEICHNGKRRVAS